MRGITIALTIVLRRINDQIGGGQIVLVTKESRVLVSIFNDAYYITLGVYTTYVFALVWTRSVFQLPTKQ